MRSDMAVEQERIEVHPTGPPTMAQSAGLTSSVEARPDESEEQHAAAVNSHPDSANLEREVGATTVEIVNCLQQYAQCTTLNQARTLTLGRLRSKLTNNLQRLNTNRLVLSDRNNDCNEVNQWVDNCRTEALRALHDSATMIENKGTGLPHREDPTTDLTGTDFTLQGTGEVC
jgi:hypothetical protein